MPTPQQITEQKSILDLLMRHPQGASIEMIASALHTHPNRRTLQRWLAQLIDDKLIRREGLGRASRYFRGHTHHATAQENLQVQNSRSAAMLVPLTVAAQQVEAYVRQPVQKRTPVGYQRLFLDSYRPNESFYLPQEVRTNLLAQGQAVANTAPAGTYARQIANRLLIDLSWNSSRLEGNTYSLLETERLLSAGESASGKDAFEAQMILNHKEAIEFLIDSANDIGLNRYTVLNLHALLSDNLLADPTASGRLRTISVGIGQTVFLPLDGPQLIQECFDHVLDTSRAIHDPFEQAFFAMVHLLYLQPFEDVNKRVARLAANIPFIARNLCPLSFVDVPQPLYISAMLGIYELNRIELLRDVFIWAYQRSCARYSAVRQSLGDPDPFRIRYRALITQTVADVVRGKMNQQKAIALIRRCADEQMPESDRARFVEVTESQVMALHEGNIARFRLRPSEFQAWVQGWTGNQAGRV